jgi:hypothetical protein
MEHYKTIYYFTETKLVKSKKKNSVPVEKTKRARVEYFYLEKKSSNNNSYYRNYTNQLAATVYVNDVLIHYFKTLPMGKAGDMPSYKHAHALIKRGETESKKAQLKTRKVIIEKIEQRRLVTRVPKAVEEVI